jgi:hypothetical protein
MMNYKQFQDLFTYHLRSLRLDRTEDKWILLKAIDVKS